MQNKTVLITGSSRGIGKAIAIKYAKEGYSVIINCSQNEEELLSTKKEIEQYHVPCLSFLGDISNYDLAAELFKQIYKTFDHLDILVNNAGISHIGLFTDMSPSDWHKVIDTNLTSVFNCSRLAAPDMVSRKSGKVINISSVWGSVGASCEVAYSASKGGINAFTKALAKELAPSNIQVNAVACGAIDTKMNGFLNEEDKASLIEEIPTNRMGHPEEVAELVYQLSHGNEYLTGQIIHLDGGWI